LKYKAAATTFLIPVGLDKELNSINAGYEPMQKTELDDY